MTMSRAPLLSVFAPLRFALSACALLLLLQGAARGQVPVEVDWFELQRRDPQLSFTPRSDDAALERLADPQISPLEQRAALTVLGISGLRSEVPRLESWALNGDPETRVAAILALGQIGWADLGFLEEQVESGEDEIGEAALVALLTTGEARGIEYVRRVRENLTHPLSTAADKLVQWYAADEGGPETRAARAYYENRYQAARYYGLIRGQAWDVIVLQELIESDAFLARAVYESAGELRHPAVRDHFLEILLSGPPPGADGTYRSLRAAVQAMPSEVSELIQSSLWTPPSEQAWRVLLDEIDRGRLEGLATGALREAYFNVPELETYASSLLVRAGLSEGLQRLELALDSDDPEERAMVARVFGGTGSQRHLDILSDVRRDPSPLVRAAATVAQFRLGATDAELELRARFEQVVVFDPNAPEPDPVEDRLILEELVAYAPEPDVRMLLVGLFPNFTGEERLEVAVALTAAGRPEARDLVRTAVRQALPPGAEGARMLRALASDPSIEDLTLLRGLFPVEGDDELNAALVEILIEQRDVRVLKVLTSALWREPWNRSCLAAGLIIEVAGVDALRVELQNPPSGATRRDRRRVGFALGEFAGIQQVEVLSERLSSSDPALQGALLGALSGRTH